MTASTAIHAALIDEATSCRTSAAYEAVRFPNVHPIALITLTAGVQVPSESSWVLTCGGHVFIHSDCCPDVSKVNDKYTEASWMKFLCMAFARVIASVTLSCIVSSLRCGEWYSRTCDSFESSEYSREKFITRKSKTCVSLNCCVCWYSCARTSAILRHALHAVITCLADVCRINTCATEDMLLNKMIMLCGLNMKLCSMSSTPQNAHSGQASCIPSMRTVTLLSSKASMHSRRTFGIESVLSASRQRLDMVSIETTLSSFGVNSSNRRRRATSLPVT